MVLKVQSVETASYAGESNLDGPLKSRWEADPPEATILRALSIVHPPEAIKTTGSLQYGRLLMVSKMGLNPWQKNTFPPNLKVSAETCVCDAFPTNYKVEGHVTFKNNCTAPKHRTVYNGVLNSRFAFAGGP